MKKTMRRNTGKPAKKEKPEKDETITILQDISATLDAILKLLEDELQEEDETGHPATVPQQPQGSG